MKYREDLPRDVREMEHLWIELSDGCRLAARIWLPVDAEDDPVPAILEYLPYRKRDGTAERDQVNHPYFAGHGYACLRVDMRGNGESDGLMLDEYAPQEQADALEVIEWIARQSWCSGEIGMIGISWGGFNGLQVAALRPQALKAVITLCSTDDRYGDDIHYKGGCLLNENMGWAATMLGFSARPPDPLLVGDGWRETWRERLTNQPLLADRWLRHQARDAYWRHGSVCEDWSAIDIPVLAVGGWGDAYSNAVPRLVKGLKGPAFGLIGPWIHKYPHLAKPEPRIGFLQECLRFWDQWLKGMDRGYAAEPPFRVFLMESAPPQTEYDARPGRWLGLPAWPGTEGRSLYLNGDGLGESPGAPQTLEWSSPQDCGLDGGEFCAIWTGPEWPGDQRRDDAASLTFDTAPLSHPLAIVGAPRLNVRICLDRPQGFLVARLCDVGPDGRSTRITYGLLNLSQRESSANPHYLVPGESYEVSLVLDDIAYEVPAGHSLRLALSTTYWPLVWPSPAASRLSLVTACSRLDLPLWSKGQGAAAVSFAEPEAAPPLRQAVIAPMRHKRRVLRDQANGEAELSILDDFGLKRLLDQDLEVGSLCRERYRIRPDDPLSAQAEFHWTHTLTRGDWRIRIECEAKQWSDADCFYLEARVLAFEGESVFHEKTWREHIPREHL